MHTGHRARLKDRYLKEGLDSFSEINALELLLTFGIPQKDVNPIAHYLLERFGSFKDVLEAPFSELLKVQGVGENTATLICMQKDLFRYYQHKKLEVPKQLTSVEAAGQAFKPSFLGLKDETIYIAALDSKGAMLSIKRIAEGTINSVQICIRKIVEEMILKNASAVIIAHNHPGGIALPSNDDIAATGEIKKALDMINVRLVDHLIFADDDFISMRDSRLLP